VFNGLVPFAGVCGEGSVNFTDSPLPHHRGKPAANGHGSLTSKRSARHHLRIRAGTGLSSALMMLLTNSQTTSNNQRGEAAGPAFARVLRNRIGWVGQMPSVRTVAFELAPSRADLCVGIFYTGLHRVIRPASVKAGPAACFWHASL